MNGADGRDDPGSRSRGRSLKEIEERVQKVRHLEPFSMTVRDDGRFSCQLEKGLDELTTAQTRKVLHTLEELADRLRRHLEATAGS